jgi:hypothetical protein
MLRPLLLVAVLAGVAIAADSANAVVANPGDADRDVILLDNRQRLMGTLEDDPTSAEHVRVRSPTGVLRLRKSKVVGVELGVTSRIAQLRADDRAGMVALARWCRERGYHVQALELLDRARRLPGFTRADAGLYAQLVDELRSPEDAVPLYAWYRSQGGNDPRILERMRELEAAGARFDGAGTAPNAAVVATAATPAPEAPPATTQGLELRGWAAENPQYSNKAELETVEGGIKAGLPGVRKALKVELPAGGDKDKAAIRLPMNYSVDPATAVLCLTMVNQGDLPIGVAVAAKTGNWVFHESVQQQVPAGGKALLRFDLRDPTFKTQASGWVHNSAVVGIDDLKELQLMIFNRDRAATVLISGMRFSGDQEL